MFRIKICGITSVEDARACVEAGADALGLNFYHRSARHVSIETAARIAQAVGGKAATVGLFVNAATATVRRVWEAVGFDLVQLHGDETPEVVAQLGEMGLPPVVRAFRLGGTGSSGAQAITPVLEYVARCAGLGHPPAAVLVDAHVPGEFGGTGKTCDWSAAAAYPTGPEWPPLVLAGGLTPENVAEAIRVVRPHAVDTAGGVESSPGRKDPALAAAFANAARAALC